MYHKFPGCTVDVQSATGFETNVKKTMRYVYKLNICHYAVHELSLMDGRFH